MATTLRMADPPVCGGSGGTAVMGCAPWARGRARRHAATVTDFSSRRVAREGAAAGGAGPDCGGIVAVE